MPKLRPVQVLKYGSYNRNTKRRDLVPDFKGIFHAWGVAFEEFQATAVQYSTAIVEKDDGQVENVPAELIKFLDKEQKKD